MRYKLIIAFVVGIITFIVYLPVLQNDFVNWDDARYIYENQNIQQGIDLKFLKWAFSSVYFALWHPLTMISLALDHAFWGLSPWGYHLTNVILHSLNTLLVFVLANILIERGLTQNSKLNAQSFQLLAAFVTALLFGIHPFHVESVAWASERKDVLCAFFFLISLLAYLRYTIIANPRKALYYIVSLFSFAMALLSKPMAVSLPIVLLILDFYPLKRLTIEGGTRNTKQLLMEKFPFILISLAASFITIWTQHSEGAIRQIQLPIVPHILAAIQAYIFYILKMLFPITLAPYYPYPHDVIIFTLEYLGPLVLFIAFTFFAIKFLKKPNPFSSIWIYYVVTLMPVIGIVQVGEQAAADRYSYLPSLGPFLFAGLGAGFLYDRFAERRRQIAAILLLVFGIMALKTGRQISVWHDSITFWSYEIKLYPDTVDIAYINRGHAYHAIGKSVLAISDFNRALMINPNAVYALNGRGGAYFALGEYQQAIKDYTKALELNPKNYNNYNRRGNAYYNLGAYQQAIKDYNMAIQFKLADIKQGSAPPGMGKGMQATFAELYYNRGTAYGSIENYEEALKDYDRVIELDPLFSRAYNNKGKVYFALGNHQQALKDIRKAVEIDPLYARAYYNLSKIYSKLGYANEAFANYKKAESLGFKPSQ